MTADAPPQCWILSEGMPGTENQCLGLAEALGTQVTVKRIAIARPWRWLPVALWPGGLGAMAAGADALAPPWPRYVIAAGRKTAPVAAALKRAAGNATRVIFVQRPPLAVDRFDVVVAPAHDGLGGANVIVTLGAMNRITPEGLAEAARAIAPELTGLPRPLVAVLIGGASRHGTMSRDAVIRFARQLRSMTEASGGTLLVTTSRRTDRATADTIIEAIADVPARIWRAEKEPARIWRAEKEIAGDGARANPYFGYLAAADAIVVTQDSVSMISEACSTGKPVYVAALARLPAKFLRLHDDLAARGLIRPFDGGLEIRRAEPLAEARRVAAEIRRRFGD